MNGTQVLSSSDFGTYRASPTKTVTLLATNTVKIYNQSSSGTLIKLAFRAIDDTPPVLTMAWPPDAYLTDSASVSLIGTFTDQTPCSLSVNDGTWSPETLKFVRAFSMPNDGPYTARIELRNSAGLSTNVNRSIVRDTQSPILGFTRPIAADTVVTDSVIALLGSWDDQSATVVTVDDAAVGSTDTIGTINYNYPLDMV
jgi:hypothetical protein